MGMTAVDRTEVRPESTQLVAPSQAGTVDFACRALDVIAAAILLVVLLPLMLVIAVAIRIDSDGPVLFSQRRLGRSLKPFTLHKFRTMMHGASHDVPISVIARDPAVLERIGGWDWQPGLLPGPRAPVAPMSSFRDRFLTAFGPRQGR